MVSPQSGPVSDRLVALYLLLDAARDRFRRLRRLRDGRFDGRDRLVRDLLGDLRSRLRRGSDGIRDVLRRPGRLVGERLDRPSDFLDRRPDGAHGLVERGLEFFRRAIHRRAGRVDGLLGGSLGVSQKPVDLASRRATGGAVGRSHRQLRGALRAVHSIPGGSSESSFIFISVSLRRVWRLTSSSAAECTIPGAYDFTIRVRIDLTSIQLARAAAASRRVNASGYCSFGQSSWYTIVPRPRSARNATSRYSRASKWPMSTQSAMPRGAVRRQSPRSGITQSVRLSRTFSTRYRKLMGLRSQA